MKIKSHNAMLTSVVYVPAALSVGAYYSGELILLGLALMVAGGSMHAWQTIANSGDITRNVNTDNRVIDNEDNNEDDT